MRQILTAILVTIALGATLGIGLGGCTSLGLAPAQSVTQQEAYAYSTLAAIRTSAAQALDAKQITVADAKQVLALSDQARLLLEGADVARGAGDTSTAAGKLALATTILTQLQTYLAARGTK